jgi:hypothetical protein
VSDRHGLQNMDFRTVPPCILALCSPLARQLHVVGLTGELLYVWARWLGQREVELLGEWQQLCVGTRVCDRVDGMISTSVALHAWLQESRRWDTVQPIG